MVKQYPDTLQATVTTGGGIDNNGDPQPGTTAQTNFICRLSPAGGSGKVKSAGGDKTNFTWVVYMPNTDASFPVGTKVQIYNRENVSVCIDTVKQFSKGQLHSRLWL